MADHAKGLVFLRRPRIEVLGAGDDIDAAFAAIANLAFVLDAHALGECQIQQRLTLAERVRFPGANVTDGSPDAGVAAGVFAAGGSAAGALGFAALPWTSDDAAAP